MKNIERLLLLPTPEWLEAQEIKQGIFEARTAGIPVQVLSGDTLFDHESDVFQIIKNAPRFILTDEGRDMSVEFVLHVYGEHLGVPFPCLGALVDCLGLKASLDLLEEWGNRALKNELRRFVLLCIHHLEAYGDFFREFPLTLKALNFYEDYLWDRLSDRERGEAPDTLKGMAEDAKPEHGPKKSRPEMQAAYAALLAVQGEAPGQVFENCLGVFTLLNAPAAKESFMKSARKGFLALFSPTFYTETVKGGQP